MLEMTDASYEHCNRVCDKSKITDSNGGFLSFTQCRVIMFVPAFRRNVLPLSSW